MNILGFEFQVKECSHVPKLTYYPYFTIIDTEKEIIKRNHWEVCSYIWKIFELNQIKPKDLKQFKFAYYLTKENANCFPEFYDVKELYKFIEYINKHCIIFIDYDYSTN